MSNPFNGKNEGKITFIITTLLLLAVVLVLIGISACTASVPVLTTHRIVSTEQAIAVIQAQYSEVSKIKPYLTPEPFKPDLVIVFEHDNQWDVIFSTGTGDCSAGCLNNFYWYFSVWPDGKVENIGEYSRVFIPSINGYEENGMPMWGFPR